MNILVAGANGTTGRLIVGLLGRTDHQTNAMIRDREQAPLLQGIGARTVLADLEGEVAFATKDVDAVIFAAGSKGKRLKEVDERGAMKLIDASVESGVAHFVMLSAINADDPSNGPEPLQPYLQAKQAADEHLQAASLPHTIVRPGTLTNEEGTGRIQAAEHLPHRRGEITRTDVARVLVASLDEDNVRNRTFEILGGDTPIEEALRAL